jgi:hypothetical protein
MNTRFTLTYRISATFKVGRAAIIQAESHYDALLIAAELWSADLDDVDAELASKFAPTHKHPLTPTLAHATVAPQFQPNPIYTT